MSVVVFVRVPHSPLKGLVYLEILGGSGAGLLKAVERGKVCRILSILKGLIKATR